MLLLSVQAQEKFSRVAITIAQKDIRLLQKAGLEFDHGEYKKATGQYITVLSSRDLKLLQQQPYRYSVIIADETASFIQQNQNENFYAAVHSKAPVNGSNCTSVKDFIVVPEDFTEGSMGGYYTLVEIWSKIEQMVSKYPTLVKVDTIGYSYENRPLVVVKISDNASVDEDEPEIFEHTLQHAREPMAMMHLIFFMQYILQYYNTDPFCKELIDSRELFYMPCMNPDGYEYNRSIAPNGGGHQRKNRNPENGNQQPIGVDLNRNYAVDWGYDEIGSSSFPAAETYRGPSAFSEPETQAIRNFVNSRHLSIHIDNHCLGNLFIHPYGVPSNHIPLPADEAAFYGYTKYLLPRYNFFVTGLAPETVGYEVNGVSSDWYIAGDLDKRKKVYSYASETGTSEDGFWPLKNRIIPLALEQFWHHFQIAYMAGGQVTLRDETTANLTANNVQLTAQITQTGIVGKHVNISLIPLENINAVTPAQTITLSDYLQKEIVSFEANIPDELPVGSSVRYVWDCFTDGIHYYDTVTRVYKGNILFTDDMEGSFVTNWTTNKDWFFTNLQSFNGNNSLHDAPGENYKNRANNVVTCNKTFDLSVNTANAYLSFYTRYIAENGYDKMTVEVSVNGTAGPFSPVCGTTTVAEDFSSIAGLPSYTGGRPNWVREWVDISEYKTATNLAFRFRMTSDNFATAEGFYIDDISLVQATSSVILPLHISSFTVTKNNQYATLQWTGSVTSNFKYFEIERSSDGKQFASISKVYTQGTIWSYTDYAPLKGTNYYRIKQVAFGEADAFSEIRSINFSNTGPVTIAPNPVKSIMQINVESAGVSSYIITSATGINVSKGALQQGTNKINLQQLSRGFYMISVSLGDGTTTHLRFIKE